MGLMNTIARKELTVLVLVVLCFVLLLMPALLHARRERRDGVRREALAALKTELEQYNNKTGTYPLTFDAGEYQYVVTEQAKEAATSWHLRTKLENNPQPTTGFDEEAGRNYYYRVVKEDKGTWYEICGGTATCGADKRK